MNKWKEQKKGQACFKISARRGSPHFSAGQNSSPWAVSLGHSVLLSSSHAHRAVPPEAIPAASSQQHITNYHLSKLGSLPPPESQPMPQKVRHQGDVQRDSRLKCGVAFSALLPGMTLSKHPGTSSGPTVIFLAELVSELTCLSTNCHTRKLGGGLA